MTCKDLLEVVHGTTIVRIEWEQGETRSLLVKGTVIHINEEFLEDFNVIDVWMECDEEIGLPCINIVVE